VNGLYEIGAGAHGVADIDAAADARVGYLERLQNIERRGPQLILRTVIVDGDADVISLTNFSMRGRVSGVGSPATMTEMPARLQYSNLARIFGVLVCCGSRWPRRRGA